MVLKWNDLHQYFDLINQKDHFQVDKPSKMEVDGIMIHY